MRGLRLHRLLQVISLLRGPSSWNARRLAAHFHTSRRNIYRDMAILTLAGIPYWYDPDFGEGGGYRIREGFFFPSIGLTNQECLDLAVVTRLAEQEGVPLVQEACHVRDKLFSTLPVNQQNLIAEATELFDFLRMPQEADDRCREHMVALQHALLAKKQIEATYKTPREKSQLTLRLQPRRIFLSNGIWYLAAHDNAADTTKLYRLARFQNIKVTDKPMTIEPSFSLREFLGNAWQVNRGERDFYVEIRFTPETAPFVEETRFHPTQETEFCSDGSLLFRATVSGLEEIKYWVLSWGPRATVLKPKELADEVRQLAAATLEQYEQGPSRKPTTAAKQRPHK